MAHSLGRFIGKVAVVTGASSGLGASIAERLTKEGLKVAGLARRYEKLENLSKSLSNAKGSFHPIKADISNEEDIVNAFKKIEKDLGPIHILINNAGTGQPNTVMNANTEDWRNTLNTNVLGYVYASKEAIRNMNENNVDGHIITIGSVLGHKIVRTPNPVSAYVVSKHAVTALAELLRLELVNAKSKIKITNVSPGLVDTEIVSDELKKLRKNAILLPEDITEGIVYVLSTPPHVQVHELLIKPQGEIE